EPPPSSQQARLVTGTRATWASHSTSSSAAPGAARRCSASVPPAPVGSAVPLLRSAAGREELDLDITFGRAPRWLRGILGSLVLERMRAPYYSPRGVVLDLLADVDRRDLSHHVAPLLRVINGRLGRLGSAPITEREVVGRRRAAEAVDMLLGAISTLDVTVRKFRRRPPRFLPGP
ncbi:MAG: hypothetical protein ABGY41_17825, partial [Candidatus Poribacteria bacterium]